MQLAVFVVGDGVLLQLLGNGLVVYLAHARVGNQLDDVQQFPRISAGVAQQALRLFHLDMQPLDILIFGQRAMKQFQQVLFAERLQHIHLTAAQQRRYHLK